MNDSAARPPTARNSKHVSTACADCKRRKIRCDTRRPCQACITAGLQCHESTTPDGRTKRGRADRAESSAPPSPSNSFFPQSSNRELAHQVITLQNGIANVQQEMQHLNERSARTAEGIARLQQLVPRHSHVPGMAPSGVYPSLPPPPVPPFRQYQSFAGAPAGYGATPQPFSSLHSNGAYPPTTHLQPGVHIPSAPPTWNPPSYGAAPPPGGPSQSSYPGDAGRYWAHPTGRRSPK